MEVIWESYEELSGLRKAAVLMLALDQDPAAQLLRNLDAESVEEVTREIARLSDVPKQITQKVLEEFYGLALAETWMQQGGLGYAKSLLLKSLNPSDAERILRQISQQVRQCYTSCAVGRTEISQPHTL